MRRIIVGLAAAGLLLAALAPSVAAGPAPQPVTIDSAITINLPDAPNSGTFTRTSGSALICAAGTVTDTRYVWDLPDHLLVDKTFDCGDGQVHFRLQVHFSGAGETFTWTILGGTEAYVGLHGHGSGTTDPIDGGVINHYTGFLVG